MYSRSSQSRMPYIEPKKSGNGCAALLILISNVLLILAIVPTLGIPVSENWLSNVTSKEAVTQSKGEKSILNLPRRMQFKREVPYKKIDISQSFVTADPGVSEEIITYTEDVSRGLLQNENFLRQFIGNGWTVHLSQNPLKSVGDVEHPAGYTDYNHRQIVIYAPQCEHAIIHEFGHYFAYIYACNFENVEEEMNALYLEEGSNFVSSKGDKETKYGKKNVHEFFACMFDNIIRGHGSMCCPKTTEYIGDFYNFLGNTDFSDIYSLDFTFRKNLENLFEEYGVAYSFFIDGVRVNPKIYDIHDFPPRGYTCQISGTNGTGTVNIKTKEPEEKIVA